MIKNLDRINKLKRENVRKGLLFVEKENMNNPVIDKIVIFGSSITEDCSEESDIDICLYSKYDMTNSHYMNIRGKIMDMFEDVCDILVYRKLNDSWKKIVDQGVIVYER